MANLQLFSQTRGRKARIADLLLLLLFFQMQKSISLDKNAAKKEPSPSLENI